MLAKRVSVAATNPDSISITYPTRPIASAAAGGVPVSRDAPATTSPGLVWSECGKYRSTGFSECAYSQTHRARHVSLVVLPCSQPRTRCTAAEPSCAACARSTEPRAALVSVRDDGNNRREEREGDVEDVGLYHIQSIARPTTADGAWRLRTADPEATRFLGGGIDLILYTPETVTTLIDVSRLGQAGVSADRAGLAISSGTTLSRILEAPEIAAYTGGFLRDVLRQVASPLQRNVATIGGAVARAHPWSDVVLALLVLDADVEVFDGAPRSVPAAEFYASRSQNVAPLVTGVRLPKRTPSTRGAFEKFGRTGFDVGLLNCACVMELSKGVCRAVRVAAGGTPALARRLPEAEEALEGKRPSLATIGETASLAARGVNARDDRRASESYRRTLTEVGVRRCLERLARNGTEGSDG